jgi:hypothetical protein
VDSNEQEDLNLEIVGVKTKKGVNPENIKDFANLLYNIAEGLEKEELTYISGEMTFNNDGEGTMEILSDIKFGYKV